MLINFLILLLQISQVNAKFTFLLENLHVNFTIIFQDAKRTEEHNVVILVDFAIALMQTLDTINRESFQRFRLRMGLNHGPVIAGVIGERNEKLKIQIF